MINDLRLNKLLDFLQDSPDDPFLKYAIAMEYLKAGDTGRALDYFKKLTSEHADYVGTYYHLGKLYEQLDKPDQAREAYKKGMEIAGKAGDAHALAKLKEAFFLLND